MPVRAATSRSLANREALGGRAGAEGRGAARALILVTALQQAAMEAASGCLKVQETPPTSGLCP